MQSISSRIWTRVAVSISYDDNNYITDTPKPWKELIRRKTKQLTNQPIRILDKSSIFLSNFYPTSVLLIEMNINPSFVSTELFCT